jgi:hexosaminidase
MPRVVYLREEAHLFLRQSENTDALPGSYDLKITRQGINIQAADKSGIFMGLQTLFQLISFASRQFTQPISLPSLKIHDFPRFPWRGFMLDEARHFQGAQTVRDLLDWMASLKMNVFHWHLSDDQGWRIESQRFPQLQEIASRRPASQKGSMLSRKVDSIPHQGFYTQEEIRSLVRYAAERHISVVPEIDIPGHCSAILAAFPHLGCGGGPYAVQPYWGIHKDILCLGNPETLPFLENLFSEILQLFPGQFIHCGGDEVPKVRWQNCPKCQSRARRLGFRRVHQLQTHLANHMNHFLQENGRSMIAWNETLADTLSAQVAVQYWLGDKKTLFRHLQAGRKCVLSNYQAYYLDHSYAHSSLEKVYRFQAPFPDLDPTLHEHILGIEAPLWSEYVPSRLRLDWQVFPRLLAVAESAWLKPERKNYAQFRQRLQAFLPQMDAAGLHYAPLSQASPNFFLRLLGPIALLQEGNKVRE